MRNNGPVTQHEYVLPDGATLVSTTDLQSFITYVNPAFIAASGFTREELLGQPHNMIRHPDMPAEAFRDMWATLKSGQPWSALVKNRRKDGGFYWVRANVTPVLENGRVSGYMSVRTKPTRDEVQSAERLYRTMREEAAAGTLVHTLAEGSVLRNTLAGRIGRALRLGVKTRITLGVVGLGMVPLLGNALPTSWHTPVVVASAAASLALAWWLRATTVAPLERSTDIVNRMAAGDLTQRLEVRRLDEIGRLNRGLSQLNVNLQAVVADVRSEVDGIHTASREIASGNNDLSARTEAQAGSLQQTASSLEQMTATIAQNAESSRKAAALASQAAEIAQQGGTAALQAAGRMQEIRGASARIADIIGTVDAISFQTNILALNAAVEAARAGEAGRGFAVVAAEVRALAQRTSGAAREIKALIEDAAVKVDAGNTLVNSTGDTAQQTLEAVRKLDALVAEISAASAEQAAGVVQVNAAVANLDTLTQQNAAMVEQLSASAASLNGQAAVVAEAVRVFRT